MDSTIDPEGISAVVCAFSEERWDDLRAAIASLQHQTLPPTEIILVIDHNPALLDRARNELLGVVVVENQETRGSSSSRNVGIAASRGSLIVFMDDDAVAEETWLERLVACMQDQRVLGAAGRIDPLWSGVRPSWFPEEFLWALGCSYRGMPETAGPIRNLWGCLVVRREVFREVGMYRTGIDRAGSWPIGGEDTELCIRGSQRWPDRVWFYNPGARVLHRVSHERATWRYFLSRCYAQGITKALVTQYVGAEEGLASERRYTRSTLPAGVARGIAEGLRGDRSGLLRALAIVTGLGLAGIGYVVTSVRLRLSRETPEREPDMALRLP